MITSKQIKEMEAALPGFSVNSEVLYDGGRKFRGAQIYSPRPCLADGRSCSGCICVNAWEEKVSAVHLGGSFRYRVNLIGIGESVHKTWEEALGRIRDGMPSILAYLREGCLISYGEGQPS